MKLLSREQMVLDGEPLTDMDGRPITYRFVTLAVVLGGSAIVGLFGFLIWYFANVPGPAR